MVPLTVRDITPGVVVRHKYQCRWNYLSNRLLLRESAATRSHEVWGR